MSALNIKLSVFQATQSVMVLTRFGNSEHLSKSSLLSSKMDLLLVLLLFYDNMYVLLSPEILYGN